MHQGILSLVGRTPLVAVDRLSPNPNVKILAKVEFFNPGGSIKDRVALAMIEAAERSGELVPGGPAGKGKVVIEATSGNTGIGLAMVCAVKGYPLLLLMPDSASEERKRIMRAYGADIRLTPGRLGTDGAIEEAYRLTREEPGRYVLMDQFNNPASIAAHYEGTGQEIWEGTGGQVTHVVAALGTSGTVMGIVKRLKEHDPAIVVAAVEPYAGHKIQGLKNMQESYPPGIYDKHALDLILRVEDEEAFEYARRLAREEGLLVGMSSGAAMAAAARLAGTLERGTIVAIFADGGERYLSTTLFAPAAEQGIGLTDVTGKRVALAPLPQGQAVSVYTIGPSLDDLLDAEAWRRIVLLDVLGRFLAGRGIETRLGVGLADLDDRALALARETGRPRAELSAEGVDRVAREAEALGVSERVSFFAAEPSLERMLAVTRRLLSRGLAYEKLRSVYFDVERDKDYGRLVPVDPAKLSLGKTVDLADYAKEHPRDFTLLKRATLQDLKRGDFAATEWGNIRPSWLLQHAGAAIDRLGPVSVVLAGQAHRFPHLENLRAIWAAGTAGPAGSGPRAWLVCQPVEDKGEGAGAGLDAIRAMGMADRPLRMWLLSVSHHKPLALSAQSLAMWARNWRRIQDLATGLKLVEDRRGEVRDEVRQGLFDLKSAFAWAMDDDLGLHRFWPDLFEFCRSMNRLLSPAARGEKGVPAGMTGAEAEACLAQLRDLDAVLQILDERQMPVERTAWPEAVRRLVGEREEARRGKDFARADTVRRDIEVQGFRIEDGPAGPRLYRLT